MNFLTNKLVIIPMKKYFYLYFPKGGRLTPIKSIETRKQTYS
jgi:hypothetical protein